MTHHADALPPEDEFEVEKETAAEATAEAAASPTASSLPPEGLSEEEQNAWWMKNVYCGHQMRQFTFRSIVAAAGIGALMAVSNLYVGLKSGWGLGVTITAAVMAYAMFKSLEAILPSLQKNPLTMLENCTILSFSGAAGAISSAGLTSAIPALYLCTGTPMTYWQMMGWLTCVATLGCFMAVPLKRQLIDVDKLTFPTGTATAETLRSLHSTGAKAMQQAKTLVLCALVGGLVKFWQEGMRTLLIYIWLKYQWAWCKALAHITPPEMFPIFPGDKAQHWLKRYALGFEPSTLFIAAGALMGIRVGISMLVGAVFFFGVLAPTMDHFGAIDYATKKGFGAAVSWTLWPSVALMVTAGLTSFAMRWRMILHAMTEITAIFGKRQEQSAYSRIETPMTWFILGSGVAGLGCVVLGHLFFGIVWWMGVLAVILTFFLSVVAARATGETDTTPIGAMGKITQLTYGVIAPKNLSTNLMTAAITAGAACHSAELLQSLKTGYLVGANFRKQLLAQLVGILIGVVVAVSVYSLIVRTPSFKPDAPSVAIEKAHKKKAEAIAAAKAAKDNPQAAVAEEEKEKTIDEEFAEARKDYDTALAAKKAGKEKTASAQKTNLIDGEFGAPSVVIWKGVAELLASGLENLPEGTPIGMVVGGFLGIFLALLEELLPKKYSKWLPSATGLGLAGVIKPMYSFSMFLGSLIAWLWMKKHPKSCDDYMVSGASGLIAGESLTGVGMNLIIAAPAIAIALWEPIRNFFGG
jgi:OPT family oligopeptide transporter